MEHRMKQHPPPPPPWGRGVAVLGMDVTALPVIMMPFISADYERDLRSSPKQTALPA